MPIYECKFTDPFKNQTLSFKMVAAVDLEVTPHQRKPSKYHIEKLSSSIDKLGFLVPLIVIENPTKTGKFLIIDGQHRFLAAQQLEIKALPVIVVPQDLAQRMINLNIEKELNIREKSYVSISLYREYLSNEPNARETEDRIVEAIEHAFYVTLGLAYEKQEELSGSIFEPVLRRCDFFLNLPIKDAYSIRDKRASQIVRAQELIKEISDTGRRVGKWHPYINSQIATWANPYKGRKITVGFDELFSPLIDNLEDAATRPGEVLDEILKEKEEGEEVLLS